MGELALLPFEATLGCSEKWTWFAMRCVIEGLWLVTVLASVSVLAFSIREIETGLTTPKTGSARFFLCRVRPTYALASAIPATQLHKLGVERASNLRIAQKLVARSSPAESSLIVALIVKGRRSSPSQRKRSYRGSTAPETLGLENFRGVWLFELVRLSVWNFRLPKRCFVSPLMMNHPFTQ